ncbi:hypothetical protein GGS26DRAFT_565523 [Hypomontagnella submonticulosa]|nr:hypothetical protein GGS26DRAFT_565523 [Hypomontagnella submonticulosa]
MGATFWNPSASIHAGLEVCMSLFFVYSCRHSSHLHSLAFPAGSLFFISTAPHPFSMLSSTSPLEFGY